MQANYVQRLRLTFSKEGAARYIGHLDLARTLERSLNRANIPVAYTQGFNRRPRLSFAAALPLGYTSEYELADIWLKRNMDPHTARDQMMTRMAPGILVQEVNEISLKSGSLQSLTHLAFYTVKPYETLDKEDLISKVAGLLAEESLLRERRRGKGRVKRYDLRPLISNIDVEQDRNGFPYLRMELLLMTGKSGRPDEVLSALDLDPSGAHIHRTLIVLDDAAVKARPNSEIIAAKRH